MEGWEYGEFELEGVVGGDGKRYLFVLVVFGEGDGVVL